MSDTENNTEYWGHKSTKINFKKHFCFHSFLKNKHLELNKNCTVKRNSDIIFFKNAPVINGTGDLNIPDAIYMYTTSAKQNWNKSSTV